jgi:hypothetical protein
MDTVTRQSIEQAQSFNIFQQQLVRLLDKVELISIQSVIFPFL